ncbi:hypothetical protein N7462_005915 [Penicillium macrosclerotiorum]|uniref:uncharacterized protein n=1 Tax=Penicillium macrosclerotiorum TaxID=303699 RepID=UPI00254847E7|nr:uncharacterized protein N7462_005915 [Penicillium macrosclerotiorum]KAJ5682750.1 hypothetical protein N7462_005915 [Penicillium macrosclerotiorum]
MAAAISKNVQTELVFWNRMPDQQLVVDFTKASPKDCMMAITAPDQKHQVQVQDVRGQEAEFCLDQNGFQFVWHDLPEIEGAADPARVESVIIPKTEELVRKVTGATRTITFAHRVRCFTADAALLADNRAPAHSVHSDFTPAGALQQLSSVIRDDTERARLIGGRVLIINVWRPLKTVQRDPLAVCDWRTLDWQQDRIANRLLLPDRWNELGKYAFNPGQQWYYLGGQQPQEALIFKQFDSQQAEVGGMTVPHTAFVDPDTVEAPARESIEIKMFAFL